MVIVLLGRAPQRFEAFVGHFHRAQGWQVRSRDETGEMVRPFLRVTLLLGFLMSRSQAKYGDRNTSGRHHSEELYDRRSVFQLGHMIRCQSGCDPLLYKRYGCFCGFKGAGKPVDYIDSCCLNHDWCYARLGCPPFMLYVLRYAWLCKRPGNVQCAVGEFSNAPFNRCAYRLCECDRAFARCVSRSACPHRKAVCWSNPLIAVTNLLASLQ